MRLEPRAAFWGRRLFEGGGFLGEAAYFYNQEMGR